MSQLSSVTYASLLSNSRGVGGQLFSYSTSSTGATNVVCWPIDVPMVNAAQTCAQELLPGDSQSAPTLSLSELIGFQF